MLSTLPGPISRRTFATAAAATVLVAAVLGRVAAYTGQRVTWKFLAEESILDLFPTDLAWDASRPPPSHAIPGRTKKDRSANGTSASDG
jgi:hypothetical protein